jgi:NADH-quinone oxidoreductase subunit N
MTLPTPSVEYFLLCPMLIVFSVAVVGVLVEAFVPRPARYAAQVTLALGGLIAAFVAVIQVSKSIPTSGRQAVLGAVAIDRPALFLQGTLLLVAIVAVIFMAERTHAVNTKVAATKVTVGALGGLDSFTPQASAVPDSDAEREAERAGAAQTELFRWRCCRRRHDGFPRIQRPVDHVRRAGSPVATAVPDVRNRHRRLLSQESAMKYFLLARRRRSFSMASHCCTARPAC